MTDPFAGLPVAVVSASRFLFEAGLIMVLAAAAPQIAQVLRLPSILVLLALGFGAGAIGALNPDAVLGANLISTLVSIAVGIILFEAGLGLDFSKLSHSAARVYTRLVTLGILLTWAVGTVAAYLLFDLSFGVALVLGAVLVVSGPTVVGPLLSFIRPSRTVNSVLMWEGTFADPIGATLGVVVFNAVVAGHADPGTEVGQFLLAIGIGAGFGVAGGALILGWARWFRPTLAQAESGILMFVVAMVVAADLIRDDTGLVTGLLMGAIVVRWPPQRFDTDEPLTEGQAIQMAKRRRRLRERIATLSTYLIGILFIILSARVSPGQIGEIGWVSLAFIAVLVLVGRPLTVGLTTLRTAFSMPQRAFIAWMAPRGIVAAATSSTFAIGLTQAKVGGGAPELIPITFIVIVATGLIYGLSGGPVARALGVASKGPGGVLLIGASPVARTIGRALHARGLSVLMWTAHPEYARLAEADGLALYEGDPVRDAAQPFPSDLDGIDYALAVGDDEVFNSMVASDLSEDLDRGHVLQLAATGAVFDLPAMKERAASFLDRVPILFDESATHAELQSRIEAGAEITVTEAPAAGKNGTNAGIDRATALPMFVYTPGKDLHVLTAGEQPDLKPGQELISLSKPGRSLRGDRS